MLVYYPSHLGQLFKLFESQFLYVKMTVTKFLSKFIRITQIMYVKHF